MTTAVAVIEAKNTTGEKRLFTSQLPFANRIKVPTRLKKTKIKVVILEKKIRFYKFIIILLFTYY